MRTVYLGTSEFAALVLRRLADSPHRPGLVPRAPRRAMIVVPPRVDQRQVAMIVATGVGDYRAGDEICAMIRFENTVLPWFGLPRSLQSP